MLDASLVVNLRSIVRRFVASKKTRMQGGSCVAFLRERKSLGEQYGNVAAAWNMGSSNPKPDNSAAWHADNRQSPAEVSVLPVSIARNSGEF